MIIDSVKIIEGIETHEDTAFKDIEEKISEYINSRDRMTKVLDVNIQYAPIVYLNGETRYKIIAICKESFR